MSNPALLTFAENKSPPSAPDLEAQTRVLFCGSVDDGKSTLIGRLLFERGAVFDDQLEALKRESKAQGTTEGLDFSLLVDGLEAEREQKITIDIAYRYLTTDHRRLIIADTPGHVQYTRNMATAASRCEGAILLVDARKGLLEQTRRHAYLVGLLGIRDIILAVNKMDLVDFSQARFSEIETAFSALATDLNLASWQAIPLSALAGDNVCARSERSAWYQGPNLLGALDRLGAPQARQAEGLRFPVQWVNRPHLDFRGVSGFVAAGEVRVGQEVQVLPAGTEATIARIVTMSGELEQADTGRSVTLVFDREIDASRGDIIVERSRPAQVADRFEAHAIWMSPSPLVLGRDYRVKTAGATVRGSVSALDHVVDMATFKAQKAETLGLNDIGQIQLSLHGPVAFDPYAENRETGSFILIDPLTHETVAAGTFTKALRGGGNLTWQTLDVTKSARARAKGQTAKLIWFTGLSGAGKSTIANLVEKKLHAQGRHTALLDGDNVRHGLNRDLGFSEADRVENIRRVAEVGRLMVEAGLIVLCSFISPFRSERQLARDLLEPGEFIEVFVDTDLETCEARDAKGLYKRARAGQIPDFTGIGSPYEPPISPEVHLHGERDPEELADEILAFLAATG